MVAGVLVRPTQDAGLRCLVGESPTRQNQATHAEKEQRRNCYVCPGKHCLPSPTSPKTECQNPERPPPREHGYAVLLAVQKRLSGRSAHVQQGSVLIGFALSACPAPPPRSLTLPKPLCAQWPPSCSPGPQLTCKPEPGCHGLADGASASGRSKMLGDTQVAGSYRKGQTNLAPRVNPDVVATVQTQTTSRPPAASLAECLRGTTGRGLCRLCSSALSVLSCPFTLTDFFYAAG